MTDWNALITPNLTQASNTLKMSTYNTASLVTPTIVQPSINRVQSSIKDSIEVNNFVAGRPVSLPSSLIVETPAVGPAHSSKGIFESLSGIITNTADLVNTGAKAYNSISSIFRPIATTNQPSVINPSSNPVVGAYIPGAGQRQATPYDSSNAVYLSAPLSTQGGQQPVQQSGIDLNFLLIVAVIIVAVLLMKR